ncbi:amylosucrase [Neptunicella marina]|uniref:amylosucrase n=1 Tax=Neptunicella marina TaxID=2125989 RepID=UPI003BB21D29
MSAKSESLRCLEKLLAECDFSFLSQREQKHFEKRLLTHFPRLFDLLVPVYQHRYDLYYHLRSLLMELAHGFAQRSSKLKHRDKSRLAEPDWYRDETMVGMACYVDLVADDLADLTDKIDYFKQLGIRYLHLMPLYKSPEGDSDGGYAVSDYRTVDPKLGTTKQLKQLANKMADAGISLALDFVFNHTSDECDWAQQAKAGDQEHQDFYFLFDDRRLPDQYDQHLREIFPSVRRGCFSYLDDMDKWVWTTFNNFQWDLNYQNPAVFRAMVGEMLYLANLGCDILRLDALAFVWKELGHCCENHPKAHMLIQAFNCCLQIVAPGVVFKSEAIVHPDEVAKYIHPEECQLSYNPLLMALIWNSLATRKTRLLEHSLATRFEINTDCCWVNYVRCHDDIGWTFDDGNAAELGINGYDHRLFLNQFFTGHFEGSYAKGMGFQFNPENGDCRVCGSLASLCGLEQALEMQEPLLEAMALARINLIHGIIMTIGGIPLIYQGDELAILNDYSFLHDPHKTHDARWVNRPKITPQALEQVRLKNSAAYVVNQHLRQLIQWRGQYPVMGRGTTQIIRLEHPHLFAYVRQTEHGHKHYFVANFSDAKHQISGSKILPVDQLPRLDLISGQSFSASGEWQLMPYQLLWLKESNG